MKSQVLGNAHEIANYMSMKQVFLSTLGPINKREREGYIDRVFMNKEWGVIFFLKPWCYFFLRAFQITTLV